MLWKHYKIVQSYEHAFEEFIGTIAGYRKQEEQEAEFRIKTSELQEIQKHLDNIASRTYNYVQQFDAVQKVIDEAFKAQFDELYTSVDTFKDSGVHNKMSRSYAEANSAIDHLLEVI